MSMTKLIIASNKYKNGILSSFNEKKYKSWKKLSIDEKLDLIAYILNIVDSNGNVIINTKTDKVV
jgi:hypothetical protein